jgi:hypothetical protein
MRHTFLSCTLLLASVSIAEKAAAAGPGVVTPAVSPPPAVVASLHLQRPEALLTALRSYVPFAINPQDLLKEAVGDLSKHVSLTAPMDLVLALDPAAGENLERPLWGFAVGVVAAEEVRQLAQGRGYLTDGKLGTYRLSVPVASGGQGLFCYLTALPGGMGRLSCSTRDRDRDVLGPYLGRLVPSPAAQAADLHGELLVATLARAYQGPWQRLLKVGALALPQRLALGQPKFDRAVTDLTQALVGELGAISRDLHTVAMDLSLQPSSAQLQLGYRLVGQESLWGQSDSEAAGRPASGPPAVFWTLPSDVTAASYRTADWKWGQRVVQLLWPVIDGYLEHDGLAAADRQALSELLLKLPLSRGLVTTVLAEGTADSRTAVKGDELSVLLGNTYYLTTSDGAPDPSVAWLKGLLATYNRPGVQAYLRKKWKALNQTEPLPTLRGENVSKQLGPGSVGVALTMSLVSLDKAAPGWKTSAGLGTEPGVAAPAGKRTPTTIYIMCTTAGERVWTAVGTDRATVLRRLAETPKLPPAKTLAQRPGLEALRQPGWQSGGFGTLAGFSSLLNLVLSASQRSPPSSASGKPGPEAAVLLAAIPHHGEVPHVYGGRPATSGAQNPLGLTYIYSAQVPRTVIEDMIALVMNIALGKDKGKSLDSSP